MDTSTSCHFQGVCFEETLRRKSRGSRTSLWGKCMEGRRERRVTTFSTSNFIPCISECLHLLSAISDEGEVCGVRGAEIPERYVHYRTAFFFSSTAFRVVLEILWDKVSCLVMFRLTDILFPIRHT